jgi:hypothetical protein
VAKVEMMFYSGEGWELDGPRRIAYGCSVDLML